MKRLVTAVKEILKGDSSAIKIAGEKHVAPGETYRPSDFVYPFSNNGKEYVFNTLTKKCYELGEKLDLSRKSRFSADEVSSNDSLTELLKNMFLVPENKDEAEFYVSFITIARAVKRRRESKKIGTYTILPTTACNARCVYCFEQGFKYETMNDEVVAQAIRYILDTCERESPIRFRWFGGEPLIGERIIDKIIAAVRSEGIEYSSTIVTNGSLITDDIVRKMQNEWKIKHAQITLDGTEEEYNTRKNYYFNYDSAYWHVLGCIKRLNSQSNIDLTIRINVDDGNIGGVLQMFRELDPFVPNKELVGVNIVPLYGLRQDGKDSEIIKQCEDLREQIRAIGFSVGTGYSTSALRTNYCMADTPNRGIVIAPNGKLYNCENLSVFPPLGDIWHGITNTELYNSVMKFEPVRDKCKGCVSLPDCTTFSKCPNISKNCKEYMKSNMDFVLKKKVELFDKDNGSVEQEEAEYTDC